MRCLARPPAARKTGDRVLRCPTDPGLFVRPVGIEAYPHLLKILRRQPFRNAEIEWLRAHCDSITRGRRVHNPDRVDPRRLRIVRPDAVALRWLKKQQQLWLHYVELALDWTFSTEHERETAYELIDRCFYKQYHRLSHHVGYERRTRYTGPRKLPHVVTLYDDLHSRVTGEVYCVHLEWRTQGARALRRIGIYSIADLIDFRHYKFWHKRLLLWEIDRELVLQMYMNAVNGNRRRDGIEPYPGWFFTREQLAYRLFALLPTTQRVMDCLRKSIHVRRAVIPLDVARLLPRREPTGVDKGANVATTPSAPPQPRVPVSSQPGSPPKPPRHDGVMTDISYRDAIGTASQSLPLSSAAFALPTNAHPVHDSVRAPGGRQHRSVTDAGGTQRYGCGRQDRS
jgi:hypothetical protein